MKRIATALVTMALVACTATACAPRSENTSADVVSPVIADLTTIDGTTLAVPLDSSVDLTGDDEFFTEWQADIADPSIVEFVPGKDDGSAQFNPGLTPLKAGTTEVTLTNESSEDVTFTVSVTD